jgi:uncharacterized protein (DUF885 family)
MRRSLAAAASLAMTACCSTPAKTTTMTHDDVPASPLAAEAVAGVTDPALRSILADHWEWMVRQNPVWATTLGDHRYDDQYAAADAASITKAFADQRALLARARAIDEASLGAADRLTRVLFVAQLEGDAGKEVCRFHEWQVQAGGSSIVGDISYVVEAHQVPTPRDGENLVARLRRAAATVDDVIANLRIGLAAGRVAPAETVRRAIAQLDTEIAKPASEWALTKPAREPSDEVKAWSEADRTAFGAALTGVVENDIRPALGRLRALYADVILPRAREPVEGLAGLPDGAPCYAATIRDHLGMVREAQDLHDLGLREIARTDAEIAAFGKKALGTADLAATIERLRTDKTLYFASGDEVVGTAQRALDRAKAAMGSMFGVLPKADCIISIIPDYEAPYTTIAYYRQPHYDGSKPGEYFVNTYQPQTRPKFEFEALSWHEAIPGHHLQIAIAQELGALPAFRKFTGSTAYVEGWALYTERLADEMGLYSSDLDRLGMASYDAWRVSRLVVDTGIHALGWTRAQAEAFMLEHTALSPQNISNEVDRYISWPGQALAYKVGQLEIFALRREAEAALGAKFRLPAFHDVVLAGGAVTLPVLGDAVRAWVAAERAK